MPHPPKPWVRLGAAVGEVFDPRSGGAYGPGAAVVVRSRIPEGAP